jgi:uncharacterized protein (TIGR02145 family)
MNMKKYMKNISRYIDWTVKRPFSNTVWYCRVAVLLFTLSLFGGLTYAQTTYTECSAPKIKLGEVGFTSPATYEINGLVLSSAVTATYCNNRHYTEFNGGEARAYKADCARNYYSDSYGSWFSWCMVVQYAEQLCPGEWRVPTREDHCQLVNGDRRSCGDRWGRLDSLGYAPAGCVQNRRVEFGYDEGFYWSITDYSSPYAGFLSHTPAWVIADKGTTWRGRIFTQEGGLKNYGLSLRCVKDSGRWRGGQADVTN